MKKLNLKIPDFDMKFTVLASGSKANCYLLHDKSETLVIEAGVSLFKVKQALDFQLGIIKGCIVSHRHKDHARYVKQYADAGINILAPSDVFNSQHHRYHPIEANRGYAVGRFRIVPFGVSHDVPCYGYLIDHPDTGRILFLTDTYLCEYSFPDLNHIIIEANYADNILEENIIRGIEHPSKRVRLLTSHMELETTKAVLKAQDLSQVENIVLIHLSERNSDAFWFVRQIGSLTGKPVYPAEKGLEVDLCRQLL